MYRQPIRRKSNDVLDVTRVCSSIEGKCDDEDDNAEHLKVGSGNEGHEQHTKGRHQKSKGSVHLRIKSWGAPVDE